MVLIVLDIILHLFMEIRERIISEASVLFRQFGIKAVTMDEIASHMGISKRTIYENFKDKDDLLKDSLKYLFTNQQKKEADIINETRNALEAIFTLLDHGLSIMKGMNPLFINDMKKYHFEVWKNNFKKNHRGIEETTKFLLKKGKNEKLIREEINIEIVSKLLHEQLKILSNEDIFPSAEYKKTEIFENIIINFARGIATDEGLLIIKELQNTN